MVQSFIKTALIGAVLTCFSTSAFAVEVKKEIILGTETATTWQKIGGWCAIADWHPAVTKCEVIKKGDDTFRNLTLGNGAKIFEKLINRTKSSYTYTILESPLPVANYTSTFSVKPDGKKTKVTWSGIYDAKDATDKKAEDTMAGVYQGGLDSIQKQYGK